MNKAILAISGCIMLAACSSPEDMSGAIGLDSAPAQSENGAETASETLERRVAPEAQDVAFKDEEKQGQAQRDFLYTWPRQVSAIPELASKLEAERDKLLTDQKAYYAEALKDCPPEFASCASRTYEVNWQVVADLPRFLSIANNVYAYEGGAHGNSWRGASVWDRETKVSLDPAAFFTTLDLLGEGIGEEACIALNAQRAERRDQSVPSSAANCVGMDEATIILSSSTGSAFDRIVLYYAPYVAGPYVEGSYEVELPVSDAVIAAVKPEYREAFAAQ